MARAMMLCASSWTRRTDQAAAEIDSSARRRATRSPIGGCVTNSAASPSSANGLTVYSGSVAGLAAKLTSSLAWSSRSSASASPWGDPQMPAATRSAASSRFGESRRWTNAEADRARGRPAGRAREAADSRCLDQHHREHGREGLHEHVTRTHVGELVREDALELGRGKRAQQACAERERRTAWAAPGNECTWEPVVDQVQLRRQDPELRGQTRRRWSAAADPRPARTRWRRAFRAERDPRTRRRPLRRAARRRRRGTLSDSRRSPSRSRRGTRTGSARAARLSRGCGRQPAASARRRRRDVALVVAQSARRPIGLRRVAATRAVE